MKPLSLLGLFLISVTVAHGYEGFHCGSEGLKVVFSRSPAPAAERKTAENFESRLLFDDGKDPGIFAGEFFASNEFDWFRTPFDTSETDVLIGFGTNSAWDLAVRKNAKAMVLVDWKRDVLLAQEKILRPLVLASNSPGEFLCHLNAVPVPPGIERYPLEEIFKYVSSFPKQGVQGVRSVAVEGFLTKLKAHPKLGPKHLEYIEAHLKALISETGNTQQYRFGKFEGMRVAALANLPVYFEQRYRPGFLLQAGAKASEVSHPYFSFLSSGDAFKRLQTLFTEKVYYAKGSYSDPAVMQAIRKMADSSHYTNYTLSLTNILDVMTQNSKHTHSRQLNVFLNDLHQDLNISRSRPLTFFQTRRTEPPHQFERMVIHEPNTIPDELVKSGHSSHDFGAVPQSDFKRASETLQQSVPYVDEFYEGNSLRLYFSDQLHVFIRMSPTEKPQFYFSGLARDLNRGTLLPSAGLIFRSEAEKKLLEAEVIKAVQPYESRSPGIKSLLKHIRS